MGQPFAIVFGIAGLVAQARNRRLLDVLVIDFEISYAARRELLVSRFHLIDSPLQRVLRNLGLGDDRHQQMRNVLIQSKLKPFRVDQDHLDLIGPRAKEQGKNHCVNGYALSRARRTRRQQVRHFLEIRDDDFSRNVFSQRQRQPVCTELVVRGFEQFPKHNCRALVVRHLNTHGRFTGNAVNAYRFGFKRQAKVVSQAGDPGIFNARLWLEFECRYNGPRVDLLDCAHHFEFASFLFDQTRALPKFIFVHGNGCGRRMEQGRGRELGMEWRRLRGFSFSCRSGNFTWLLYFLFLKLRFLGDDRLALGSLFLPGRRLFQRLALSPTFGKHRHKTEARLQKPRRPRERESGRKKE